MYRRASTTTLKESLIQLHKAEILAAVAGIRTMSTVEGSEDGGSKRSSEKED